MLKNFSSTILYEMMHPVQVDQNNRHLCNRCGGTFGLVDLYICRGLNGLCSSVREHSLLQLCCSVCDERVHNVMSVVSALFVKFFIPAETVGSSVICVLLEWCEQLFYC